MPQFSSNQTTPATDICNRGGFYVPGALTHHSSNSD